jgi:putative FmdB family regulatory protein
VPTYQYVCTECGGQLEAVQRFTDDPLTVHEACGGKLRKVFSPVGIVFKGSGFYRTDSRSGSGSSSTTPSPAASSPAESGSSGSSSAESSSSSTSSSSGGDKGGDKGSSSGSSGSQGSPGKSSEKVA